MNVPVIPLSLISLLAAAFPLTAQEKPAVRTVLPAVASTASTYEIPGRTEPVESATIFTRATGIVSERKFDIGDRVKAGEVLAVIAAPELDRAVDAARATVQQSEARAKTARLVADRSAGLYANRAVSQEESEQRISTADETEAALRSAKAEQARLEELQKFCTVIAPFDGTIAARNFDRGDRMRGDSSTSEGWLYRLVRLNTLRFVISATPDLAFRISQGTEATVRFNELPGRTFPATLSRSSQVYDTTTGTMRGELLIENKDLLLPAGLTGIASFKLPPPPSTFLLPTNTLLVRNGKSTVATVQDGKIHFVEALAGKNTGTALEITSAGLTAETPVIVNPNAMLREGDPVEASSAAPAK
jgi:RND family efflux transporter MFP subunit